MYHCKLNIYLAGRAVRTFETIKAMPPLEHFAHTFSESQTPDRALARKAGTIIADLSEIDMNPEESLAILLSGKRADAELILLADESQTRRLAANPAWPDIHDIWPAAMSDGEVRFRFLRWQQNRKMRADFWLTSQYLESTINNIPNLVWYKNKNGIHEKVNDSFCRAVNKTKDQVQGRSHAYIWDVEQDDPACIASEEEVMNQRQTCVSEEHVQTGEGMRILTTYKSPLFDLDGSVMGTLGVAIDITQERAYEQEISQKNETLERIFTTIDCGVMRHTVDGSNILSVNRAALKILDYETREEMQKGFDLIAASVLDEDKEQLRKSIKTLKHEGDSVSVEYRVKHKDGEILHVMGNVKLFRENGQLIYQRFLLDCTAQKLQEKEKERQQMELVQALSVDFSQICFVDPSTGITTMIRRSQHGLDDIFQKGKLLRDSMEQYIQKWVHADDREMLRRAASLDTLKEQLAEKNQYYANYRKCKDGEITYFQMKAVGVGTNIGSSGIVLGLRDVDEEIHRELEQKNLLEAALSQANKASQAKSVFLSNMSHDIRTPMNAIVGFTNLALSRIDQKEQVAEYLKKIKTSGNHLLSLINDVLDMSHIESGKIHLEEKPCSLPDILQGLHNILQADIRAKKLSLQTDTVNLVNEDIYCDELRLNQVLLNLLSNAVKYTNEGGAIQFRVTEKTGAPAGCANYEFLIKDNGIGMSQEFANRIFEPFERESNSTISRIQGTGLGMAITKNLVDLMNGSISVTSEQGKGSEFKVSFTFRLCAEANAPQNHLNARTSQDQENRNQAAETARYTGRILLVEDVELNQEIAVAILQDAGFSTEVAENGRVAIDMVRKSEPGYYQLVLMDIQMPVMNGYEATREIRRLENPELASIPIIAMTANAFEEDRQAALNCGMNSHIAKPIDIEKLFETLDSIL